MNYTHENIFKVICGNDTYIIYAPLLSAAFMANEKAVEEIANYIFLQGDISISDKAQQAISWLASKPMIDTSKWFPDVERFCDLVVLPNFKCNFHCSYCYSAQGRSSKEISYVDVIAAVDYCLKKAHEIKRKYIRVSFLGGGEPLMSWDLIERCLAYIKNQGDKFGIKTKIGITTNGSLITQNIANKLKYYNCSVNISFDILPEIQNVQRGQFNQVHNNILLLNNLGIIPSLRSTITQQNVLLMDEMVEFVHIHYPHIRKLHFEPVTDEGTTFSFYHDFIVNFLYTKNKATHYNIDLICSISKCFDNMRMRFCSGELCLTPNGRFSICHRASSPKEELYISSEYGGVINGKVDLEIERANVLISKVSVQNTRCQNCFVRWHCGGGCYFQQEIFTEEQKLAYCHFIRSFIKLLLYEYINEKPHDDFELIIQEELSKHDFDDSLNI